MCTIIPRSHGPSIQLKWHSLRRHASDPAMLRANLEAGLATGAVMEADIHLTRDGQWVCIHDETLYRETTGHGAVREYLADDLRGLTMRSPTGRTTASARRTPDSSRSCNRILAS